MLSECVIFAFYFRRMFYVIVVVLISNEFIETDLGGSEEYGTTINILLCLFRTLHNYMMWHLVKSMSSLLSKPFRDAQKEFMKALTGALNITVRYGLFSVC